MDLISVKLGRYRPRSGAVLVEFAIVLPIIVVIFSGMIEISRVMMLQHTADTAAYEGARAGMVPGASAEEAKMEAKLLLQAAGLKAASVTVIPDVITEETAFLTVAVHIPVAANSWITPTQFFDFTIKSEVSLFCERSPVILLTGIPDLKKKKSKLEKIGEKIGKKFGEKF